MNTHTYETLGGTEPDPEEQHDARTLSHTVDGSVTHLMTEIEDGLFVAWSTCGRCLGHVTRCSCPSGPVEPKHLSGWRVARFENSFGARGVEPALPVTLRHRDRRVAAVIRFLRARGWTIEPPLGQRLETAPVVDKVDDLAIHHLTDDERNDFVAALDDDAIIDPDDIHGISDEPDYGGHVEPVQDEPADTSLEVDAGLAAALERLRTAKQQRGAEDVGI